MKYSSQRF